MEGQKSKKLIFALAGVFFAVYCIVFGESGILVRLRLFDRMEAIEARIAREEDEGVRLQELLKRYRSGEMMKEEAYRAGFIDPGCALIFFGKSPKPLRAGEDTRTAKHDTFDIAQARVLWIVISITTIMLAVVRYKKTHREE